MLYLRCITKKFNDLNQDLKRRLFFDGDHEEISKDRAKEIIGRIKNA